MCFGRGVVYKKGPEWVEMGFFYYFYICFAPKDRINRIKVAIG